MLDDFEGPPNYPNLRMWISSGNVLTNLSWYSSMFVAGNDVVVSSENNKLVIGRYGKPGFAHELFQAIQGAIEEGKSLFRVDAFEPAGTGRKK